MFRRQILPPYSWILLLFVLNAAACAEGTENDSAGARKGGTSREADPASSPLPVRPSALAGSWYPSEPDALRAMLSEFFARPAVARAQTEAPDGILAVVSPHAGFRYSQETAPCAMSLLAAREPRFRRIVILAPSHSTSFPGVSIGNYSAYQTPLGDARIDGEAVAQLRRCALVGNVEQAHLREHAIEMQVPMLQFAFGDEMPPIVPILIGSLRESDYAVLAEALRPILDRDTAVVVSSDFAHYGQRFHYTPFPHDASTQKRLLELNDRAIAAIQTIRRAAFQEFLTDTRDTICGRTGIALLLDLLAPDTQTKRLHYATSGSVEGNYESSVTYAAVGFFNPAGWPAAQETSGVEDLGSARLTQEEENLLLDLARRTLEAAVRREPLPDLGACRDAASLMAERAAFVTLTRDGRLRGCIGSIFPHEPLAESVRRHAMNAALRDRRFRPVTPEEFSDIHIEVSALTVPEEIDTPDAIRLGTDGIVLQVGEARSVYLPKVATDQGWTLEQTLTELSLKAGLAKDAWRRDGARILTYQAQVFEEQIAVHNHR